MSSTSASPTLGRLEGPGADEREPRLALPADLDEDGILERWALADELGAAELEVDGVPVEPGAEAGGEPGGYVGGEHRGAEEHRVEAFVRDELRQDVHARLGQRGGERRVVGREDASRRSARTAARGPFTPEPATTAATSSPSCAALERTPREP